MFPALSANTLDSSLNPSVFAWTTSQPRANRPSSGPPEPRQTRSRGFFQSLLTGYFSLVFLPRIYVWPGVCRGIDQDICAGRLAIRSRSCVAARQTTAPTLGRPGVSSRKFRGTSIRKSWQVCEHILYGVFSINSRLCSLRTLALGGGKFGAVGWRRLISGGWSKSWGTRIISRFMARVQGSVNY